MTRRRVGVTSKLNAISSLEIHYVNALWVELASIFPIAEEAYPVRIKPHHLAWWLRNHRISCVGVYSVIAKTHFYITLPPII